MTTKELTAESRRIHEEAQSGPQQSRPEMTTWDGTYGRFLVEISQEGIKGRIKRLILKFIGFFAYWQEQVNMHVYGEVSALVQKAAELEKELLEQKGVFLKRREQVSAEIASLQQKVDRLERELQQIKGSVDSEEGGCLAPPKEMLYDGSGKGGELYKGIGDFFLRQFIDVMHLKPNERVLDVGCGIGRVALPLTSYLDKDGLYEGFDIVPDGINWCRENISPTYPNFHFQVADVFNKFYHPQGKYQACEYKFPYGDGYFDFVFLTSVFTHMLPGDMKHYLHEISRVLKKGGRCLITFFLMDREHKRQQREMPGVLNLDFKCRFASEGIEYFAHDEDAPEAAVSYYEEDVRRLYETADLRIAEPVIYGFQDIVIAYKD